MIKLCVGAKKIGWPSTFVHARVISPHSCSLNSVVSTEYKSRICPYRILASIENSGGGSRNWSEIKLPQGDYCRN